MRYLIDTGVLLRLFNEADASHKEIMHCLRQLRSEGHDLVTAPQNIAEFWNVSTRPASARGGYGQSIESTDRRVSFIESVGTVLQDRRRAYWVWRELVRGHSVKGVQVHDARLVALMIVSETRNIVTLNVADFKRYNGILALTPLEVIRNARD